jgi:hypothetical protein
MRDMVAGSICSITGTLKRELPEAVERARSFLSIRATVMTAASFAESASWELGALSCDSHRTSASQITCTTEPIRLALYVDVKLTSTCFEDNCVELRWEASCLPLALHCRCESGGFVDRQRCSKRGVPVMIWPSSCQLSSEAQQPSDGQLRGLARHEGLQSFLKSLTQQLQPFCLALLLHLIAMPVHSSTA